MTIRAMLDHAARQAPDAPAMRYLRDHSWRKRTYGELAQDVARMAEAFARFEIKPGAEQVAIIMENGPEWVETYLANAAIGVAVVPLDPKLRAAEVEFILRDSESVALFCDARQLPMLEEILPRLPGVRAVVALGGQPPASLGGRPCHAYEELRREADAPPLTRFERNRPAPHDIASIIYTSGTTGRPKGAMLTHLNFCADVEGALEAVGAPITARDDFLVVLPLFHSFSFTANFILPLARGACMSFIGSLRSVTEDLKTLRPTIFFAVPLLVEKLYERVQTHLRANPMARLLLACGLGRVVGIKARRGFGGRLRFLVVGGAPSPLHILKGLRALGIPVVEGYGLTECAPVVSIPRLHHPRPGTIGAPLPNINVRIANPNDKGVGELQVRGPIVMRGYYKDPEATREAFDGEWLRTGDLATIDADSHITIRGRLKALIVNREGKNIYPEEVEGLFAGDPLIADIVVLGYTQGGVPGERVGAIAVPDPEAVEALLGPAPGWDEVERLVRERVRAGCATLADYKHPRKIIVERTALERTSIQKVRRHIYAGRLDE